MGGQAYLSLENNEDPFLHGIKFTAMPPSKRFREMEQLSGGEKVDPVIPMLLSLLLNTLGCCHLLRRMCDTEPTTVLWALQIHVSCLVDTCHVRFDATRYGMNVTTA